MSRLGLRPIRKPNIKGAAFVVDAPIIRASVEPEEQVTNGVQTGNKEITKQVTNGVQTGNKQVTWPPITDPDSSLTKPKQVTERVTSNRVNGAQTGNKQVTNSAWETLRGLEARLLQFIFEECYSAGDLLSPPLTLDRIATCLESQKNTAKTIVFRLTQKGLISREASATGRGGFTRFRIEKNLYQALLLRGTEYKRVTNGVQTGNKEVTERVTERVTSVPSSSSSLILEEFKTTTTGEPELFESVASLLSPEWRVVDCSPLSEIGFTETHLNQLAKYGKLSTSEVQDSIHFFAFDLKRNGKGRELKGPPLNFFMGIIRKGLPYAPPENYESPEQVARRTYLDGKRRIEEQRLAEEREILDLEFSEWRRGLSQAQITGLVPEVVLDIAPARESSLKVYFEEHVWPVRSTTNAELAAAEREEVQRQVEQSLGEVRV